MGDQVIITDDDEPKVKAPDVVVVKPEIKKVEKEVVTEKTVVREKDDD